MRRTAGKRLAVAAAFRRLAFGLAILELTPMAYLALVSAGRLRDWERAMAVDLLGLTAVPTCLLVVPAMAALWRGKTRAGGAMVALAPMVWVALMLTV